MWYGLQRPNKNLTGKYDVWIENSEDTYIVGRDTFTTFLSEYEPVDPSINDIWIGSE